ncbi:MAG: hypothetical protein IMZ47_04160 [Firmicutes bacterium]|nr:hypothetical protein [Bacillota bacterium]
MKQQMKSLVSILIITLIIVALYSSSYIPYDSYISKQIEAFNSIETTPDDGHYGYMQPQVVDGFSEEPIEGATVVIPETGQKFVTSKDGLTALIQVPVLDDKHFADISPKPWGEVTLIVYKKGYIEYVLFYTHVWESQTRKGPKVLLFPEVEGDRNEPFAIVEGPHRLWVNELVEKYRP